MEVPLLHSDAVQWTDITLPSSSSSSSSDAADVVASCCPASDNVAGGGSVWEDGTSSSLQAAHDSVVWRIHGASPKVLELMELSSHHSAHRNGLHVLFDDELSPFACVIPSLVAGKSGYIVWVVTVRGVVYRMRLLGAAGSWMLCGEPQQHEVHGELPRLQYITTFAATPEMLCLGGQSGSIICISFGTSSHTSPPAIVFELKDGDAALSRLWGFAFRGKNAGPVKSLVVRSMNGSTGLFAFLEDGTLRVWDLLNRHRLLNCSLSSLPELEGRSLSPCLLYVPISLCSYGQDGIRYCESLMSRVFVSLGYEGLLLLVSYCGLLDLKLLQHDLWILQRTSKGHELFHANLEREQGINLCRLQEKFVAEQLLQGSGHEWDDLLFAVNPFAGVSVGAKLADVYLRRLLQPGVRQHAALQHALNIRNRPLSASDLASISLDGLRNHIVSAVESQNASSSYAMVLHEWKCFSNDYQEAWEQNSTPYGLVFHSGTGSVGLIRSNSVSVIRSLSSVEYFLPGGESTSGQLTLPMEWKVDDLEEAGLLTGLLQCTDSVAKHLGGLPLAVLYELLLQPVDHPVPALLANLVRILDIGFTSIHASSEIAHIGVDDVRAKEQEQHQRQRTFAFRITQSLQTLQGKAGGWGRLLRVIRKYANLLVLTVKPLDLASRSSSGVISSAHKKLLAQATSQLAWAHFEAARNLLLLLSYIVKLRSEVVLSSNEVSTIQLHLIPQVQETMAVSLLLHWLTVTFAEVPPPEDFSSQLSSLRLDGNNSRSGSGRLGTGDLTLAELLIPSFLELAKVDPSPTQEAVPNPERLLMYASQYISWLLLGEDGDHPLSFSGRAISLSNILLQYGQYGNLESFLMAIEHFSSQQTLSEGVRTVDGHWCARLHLLGFCLLACACTGLQNSEKEKRIGEAIRCFFQAASGGEANEALQTLFLGTGYKQNLPGRGAAAAWRLRYFEWVMQIFEQYKLSEGARQFAHAALEQVDEAVGVSVSDNLDDMNPSNLSAAIKGRLWGNICKFSLDMELYSDAYCAIISNPDEDSKTSYMRRFISVLCERKVTQVLCGQELPYAGLLEKVDQELLWKAENSDVSAKPTPYKLLYSLHMYRHNWRRAAAYMYRYTVRLREESREPALPEELRGLGASINALQLVDPTNAWFHLPSRACEWLVPSKRQRLSSSDSGQGDAKPQRVIDLQDLEKEYALTKARMQLANSDIKHPAVGWNATPEEVVWSLVQCRLYDTAFSLLFLFWKDSSQKRELEKVMEVMARNCCMLQIQEATSRSLLLLLTASVKEDVDEATALVNGEQTVANLPATGTARFAWQALQSYLEKYKVMNPRLPVVVAESILTVDRHMELPLWLVDIFKGGRNASAFGMAGEGADPAALLRIYLDFERFAEATSLVLEYIQAWSSLRPADIIKRKHMCAVWFPYTLLDRLQRCLASSSDTELRENLQGSLKIALQNHFKQVKVDSDDVRK
ncbi:unnamed protein product [Sphagnum balticum]